MSSVPTLGYWDTRALAEPIRLLLKYVGIKFNDKRYEFGEGAKYKEGKEWLADKCKLDLDFPNLPYYIDGDVKLTQRAGILRYLGRKHGLVATDEQSLARQDMVEQQMLDCLMSMIPVITSDDFETEKIKFISETLTKHLDLLSKFLGQNDWFAGSLTYVDFIVFETLDWFREFSAETVDKFPNLIQYLNRFENLPPIKAYRTSSEFKAWPILKIGSIAKWGYRKQ